MAEPKDKRTASLSIQARGRGEVVDQPSILTWLTVAGELISPWWSRYRDAELRRFWPRVDHLAGALYTVQSRLATIPFRVEPRDLTFKTHIRQAEKITEMLLEDSEYGKGWNDFYEPFLEDWFGQDNGTFVEVIGEGKPDGPIVGPVLSISHLDSQYCTRTSNPEFPVLYADPDDGRIYKLHRSRVIFASQMPSADVRMNKVGKCAVSRCLNVAQNIYDILVYKQEKLGSRPQRGLIVTGGGLTPDMLASAFEQAQMAMSNQKLSRFSKFVAVGAKDAPEASVDITDLASIPDGFDERDSMTLGMAAIALAFGVDARELFPGLSSGATRAEALISHLKQRGKGLGQTIMMVERKFSQKILPPHLKLVFDFQDDAQDAQVAEIRKQRADTRVKNIQEAGVTDTRTEREHMLKDGELTPAQFVKLELESGRLEDGSDVVTLFANKDFFELLSIGVENVLEISTNDKNMVLTKLEEKRAELMALIGAATNLRERLNYDKALAAVDGLEILYGKQSESTSPSPTLSDNGREPSEEDLMTPPEMGSEDLEIKGDSYLDTAVSNMTKARETLDRLMSGDGKSRR